MWVVILFGIFIGLFAFLMIKDVIVYKDYPISDEYWLTGIFIIGFLAAMISMILA